MREAYVVASVRTAVGKANKGTLKYYRPDDLAADAIRGVLSRVEGFDPARLDDIIIGCAMPEGEQGMNVARIAAFRAEIPATVPAMTMNRFCSSGLQTVATAAERILVGAADAIIAGGTETMTMIPMGGVKIVPNPWLAKHHPEVYMGMGLTAERVAEQYGITREAQDRFAYESHMKALRAIDEGRFKEEIIPIKVPVRRLTEKGKVEVTEVVFDTDEGPRRDTSLESLARLRPVFKQNGTVTAGNSSQMSDGAAAALVMSGELVKELGIKPLARFCGYAVAGCEPEVMGLGPVYAIPKVLRMTGLSIDEIGVIELNEAFAAQSLGVIKALELPEERINVNGGAIALGHPLGCTGAKLLATALHEARRRQATYAMVTMCIGGGMGAAGVFEIV
jgi:acetyl-CoA acyltransferase